MVPRVNMGQFNEWATEWLLCILLENLTFLPHNKSLDTVA